MASSVEAGIAATLEGWLRGQHLQRFLGALVEEGCEDIAFLRTMDDGDVAELCGGVGMKKMQTKRFVKAVAEIRASPAVTVAPAVPAAAARPAPAPDAPPAPSVPKPVAPAPAEPTPASPSTGAEEQAPEPQQANEDRGSASSVPVRIWLDVVQPGFGAKFSSAFEAAGLDLLEDLAGTNEAELAELEEELVEVGAKKAHLRKLKTAIRAQFPKSTPSNSPGPSAANAPRPSLRGDGKNRSGKRFAAFLSHHKVAAAMDARFVKDKLEQMLGGGAEVFLDSDNLQDLRLLLDHVRNSDVLVLFQACPCAGGPAAGRPLVAPAP